jgi:septum formation protein
MNLPLVILASASPRRVELLKNMGVSFQVIVSDVPEIHHDQLTAGEAAQVNAYRKARAVAKKLPDALVIGADTLVHLNGKLFGKPADLTEAYGMLEELEGRTHQVTTAVCLLHLRERRQRIFSDDTSVTFRHLDASKIRRYLAQVNPLDKAGGYAIQEGGEAIIERIDGSYTNVVGLPVERLTMELRHWSEHWPVPGIATTVAQAQTIRMSLRH